MSAANSSSRGDLGEQVQRVSQPASPHSGAAAILVGVEDQERGTHAVHDHDLLAMRHCFACPSRDPQFLGFDLRRSGFAYAQGRKPCRDLALASGVSHMYEPVSPIKAHRLTVAGTADAASTKRVRRSSDRSRVRPGRLQADRGLPRLPSRPLVAQPTARPTPTTSVLALGHDRWGDGPSGHFWRAARLLDQQSRRKPDGHGIGCYGVDGTVRLQWRSDGGVRG